MASLDTISARQRKTPLANGSADGTSPHTPTTSTTKNDHPLGPPAHGPAMQVVRIVAFTLYFFLSCLAIYATELLGLSLYLLPNKDFFHAWVALTKQHFGILATAGTQIWSPTVVRISGDKSMKGLLKQNPERGGMLEVDFGERVILMANHQIYTDWLYLWWIAYANSVPAHGHLYIILKETLKWVPLIGPAMQIFGFIFMARKWATDKERLRYRLQKLNTRHFGPLSGSRGDAQLDPMWLFIFPEGTNLSANTRVSSVKYANKTGIPDMRHQLLPRSTGLQFCLQELKDTVPYLYDCTIAYEGIPAGGYGGDIFTLRSVYFQGRPPKSVNMHWRRFKISEIPYDDSDAMSEWVLQRWREKDDLLEAFLQTGKFPADEEGTGEKEGKYLDTEVKPRSPWEFLSLFAPLGAAYLIGRIGVQILDRVFGTEPLF